MQLSQSQIKNGWKVVKLGDVATFNYGKSLPERDRIVGDFPVYASAGKVGTHNSFLTKAPAIVVGRKGNVGATYFVKENFYTIDTAYFIQESKNYNLKYLYYQLGILHLKELNTDSAVPGLNREVAYAQLINLPPLPTQEKIAVVLSAYDDLIENNDKRIKVLEAMAQKLYTEWFVNFKCPGYEKVKMVASGHPDFGMIPEGWEVKSFYEVVNDFDNKRKPISSLKRGEIQGAYPYYGAAKIIDNINDYIFDGKYLLVAEDGSVVTKENKPVLQFVNEKFWVSNHAHVVTGKLLSTELIYLRLSHYDIRGLITGAAQPKITKENLNRIQFLIPDIKISKDFDMQIINIFNQVFNLQKQNQSLKKSRDFLIPQLVGGRVEVRN